MATTTEVPVSDTADSTSNDAVVVETGGEQLSDPTIVAADAKAVAAPVPGPVNVDVLNSNGTQTVQTN